MYDIQVCCYTDFLQPDEDTGLEGIPLETVHRAVMSLVYLIIFFRTCLYVGVNEISWVVDVVGVVK